MSDQPSAPQSRLGQLAANAVSLIASDVLNKVTTFVVYLLIPRYLGTREFGQLSLGLLLLYSFQVFATVGLPTLVTRDVSRRKRRTGRYFTSTSVAVAAMSGAATLVLVLFTLVMRYDADTTAVILLLSLGMLPYALTTVTEALFRAWERMHYIAYANVPMNVAKVFGAYLVLERGDGIVGIALLLLGCRVGTLLIEWALLFRYIARPAKRVSLSLATKLVRQSTTFLGIDGLIAIWASLDAVLLSKLAGEEQVGLYSAACQLFVPVILFYQCIVVSVFPTMCRMGAGRHQELGQLVRWLTGFLLTAGVPSAIGLFFLARQLLPLVYGEPEMAAAAVVIHVLAIQLLLRAIIVPRGNALWASHRERLALWIVAVDLIINFVLGFLLIQQFGLLGAAVAALVTWIVNALLHWWATARLLGRRICDAAAWRVAVAGVAMTVSIVVLQSTGIVVATSVAVAAYVTVLSTLLVGSHGGLGQFRTAYFAPLLK